MNKRLMRDKVTFTRKTVAQDAFGDNVESSSATIATVRAHVKHMSGEISQRAGLENTITTDFEMYFRKKSVSAVQKGDFAELETPNVTMKINEIVEHDLQTIKMIASSVD